MVESMYSLTALLVRDDLCSAVLVSTVSTTIRTPKTKTYAGSVGNGTVAVAKGYANGCSRRSALLDTHACQARIFVVARNLVVDDL